MSDDEQLLQPYLDFINKRNVFNWNGQITLQRVMRWMQNFRAQEEKLMALDLLIQFTYHKQSEIHSLLKSGYNLLCHEILFNADKNKKIINNIKTEIESSYIFLGMVSDNPSKSGTHLLLPFREVNGLPESIFPHDLKITHHTKNIVFIDDILSSGDQAIEEWTKIAKNIQKNDNSHYYYLVLFAVEENIKKVENQTGLKVIAVNVLDDTQKVFSSKSGYFSDEQKRYESYKMCWKYGKEICKDWPIGYKDSQLLIGFNHSIPDNTLPIMSVSEKWFPIFEKWKE